MMDEVLKYKRLDGVVTSLRSLVDGFAPGGKQRDILSSSLKPNIPALVIWGDKDKIIPVAHAANAKGARVEVLEDAGHMPHMEKASKVTGLIKEMIKIVGNG
jgi:pyruvate dehydrogenase E2 component (dihydrolipoamide acetyltransferase)